jgi:hypothetical protein
MRVMTVTGGMRYWLGERPMTEKNPCEKVRLTRHRVAPIAEKHESIIAWEWPGNRAAAFTITEVITTVRRDITGAPA